MKSILAALCLAFFSAPSAFAMKTASSFDISWANAALTLSAQDTKTGLLSKTRSLSSSTGIQIDYNVALFDYRSVATLSFSQFETSNLGSTPLTRVALGGSYHFFRINGQRVILDSDVESKVWGISPAIELSLGISKLSIKDPQNSNLDFAASVIDFLPRILIEFPVSSNFLLMFRGGYYTTLSTSKSQFYDIGLSGMIVNIGIKLTTL